MHIRPLTHRFPQYAGKHTRVSLTEIHALEETKFNSAPQPALTAQFCAVQGLGARALRTESRNGLSLFGADSTGAPVPRSYLATSPGARSPLGGPPHLSAALIPSRRRRRGSWCPSPMPSGAGSHVPGSAAVPALPRLAPHPTARQQAGGRGRLWADAGAAPNPSKQMLPVCHPLGDAIGQCRRRSACPPRLLSRERRKATVLAEQRPPASLTDFQRRPSFTRFAPVTAH